MRYIYQSHGFSQFGHINPKKSYNSPVHIIHHYFVLSTHIVIVCRRTAIFRFLKMAWILLFISVSLFRGPFFIEEEKLVVFAVESYRISWIVKL